MRLHATVKLVDDEHFKGEITSYEIADGALMLNVSDDQGEVAIVYPMHRVKELTLCRTNS